MYLEKLKEMFSEMVVKKNASLAPLYYHANFLLYTNEKVIDYSEFLESHEKYYSTPIQYEVQYAEETFLEEKNKI